MTEEEGQVTLDIAGKPVHFLIYIGATHSGPITSKTCSVMGINRVPRFGLILSPFVANGLYRR